MQFATLVSQLRRNSAVLLAILLSNLLSAAADAPKTVNLAGYRTVRTALTTTVQPIKSTVGLSGFLGVHLTANRRGELTIDELGAGSPAATAGIREGDILLRIGNESVHSVEEVRTVLQSSSPGDVVKLYVQRGLKTLDFAVPLVAISRPLKLGEQRAIMGVRMGQGSLDTAGLAIAAVTKDKAAAKAGLKPGDVILKADNSELSEALSLTDALSVKRPGESVRLVVRRGQEVFEKSVELEASESRSSLAPEEERPLTPWTKPAYRLAVILIEFADTNHNAAVKISDWSNSYFTRGTYNTTNALGQRVFGSMNDYFQEQSCGKLRIEGKVFNWIRLKKNRADYYPSANAATKAAVLNEAVDALIAREGADALRGFDGLAFIYAGEKYPTSNRGSLYWPHRSSFLRKGKSWPYVIVAEGGSKMADISTMCHETGHILGLPDLYARPENPGSEGEGSWCAMSSQARGGRPQHFSAWCKEQLGWVKPVVIDPTVKQKLILGPIEGSTNECYKILARPDGSEYFLLENRRKVGFDASLAAPGLLIWRVVANRPILEESHGILGPSGPKVFLNSVPYPSKANNSFTPYTTPSSRAQLGGGSPVYITNIRQLKDGRIAFLVGYEFE